KSDALPTELRPLTPRARPLRAARGPEAIIGAHPVRIPLTALEDPQLKTGGPIRTRPSCFAFRTTGFRTRSFPGGTARPFDSSDRRQHQPQRRTERAEPALQEGVVP